MDDRTEYVDPPEYGRPESLVSIWVVGAVALIALFTLFGLYMAHYSLMKRMDATAAMAKQERAELSGKVTGLQQQLRELTGGGMVVTRSTDPEPADEPSATETAAAPPRPVTEAPAKTDEVSVRLESAPTGARVLAGREALGVTPLTLELGPRQRRKVKLVLKGYRVQWVTVSAARRTLNVRLARLTAQGARGAKGAKGARAKRGARKVTEDSPLFNPYGD